MNFATGGASELSRPADYGEAGGAGRPPAGLTFDEVRRLLPHQERFILIDRVVSLDPGRRIVCCK